MSPTNGRPTVTPNSTPTSRQWVRTPHDPEHLAGSLVELIARSAGQEVGSHTFSHYYCLEAGQNGETFRSDLAAAQAIANRHSFEPPAL